MEFGHVVLPVLYVLMEQREAEHLAGVAPADNGGAFGQPALREVLGGQGGVLGFEHLGTGEELTQGALALQQGLDVR